MYNRNLRYHLSIVTQRMETWQACTGSEFALWSLTSLTSPSQILAQIWVRKRICQGSSMDPNPYMQGAQTVEPTAGAIARMLDGSASPATLQPFLQVHDMKALEGRNPADRLDL